MVAQVILMTDLGLEKTARAAASGTTIKFHQFAVGDANGTPYSPTGAETALVNEKWCGDLGEVSVPTDDPRAIEIAPLIPENTGGYIIREFGIYDEDGDLVAIGVCEPINKPDPATTLYAIHLEIRFKPDNASAISFKLNMEGYVTYTYLLNDFIAQTKNIADKAITAEKFADKLSIDSDTDFKNLKSKGIVTQGAGIIASGSNANGSWVKYANGLIRQRGLSNSIPAGSKLTVNLPIVYSSSYTPIGQAGTGSLYSTTGVGLYALNLASVDIYNDSSNGAAFGVYWQTEGY